MLVSEARTILSEGGLQVTIGDSSGNTYNTTQADNAIKYVGNDFVQRCPGITQTMGTIGTAYFGTTFSLSINLTGFYPDNALRVFALDYAGNRTEVKRTDFATVVREQMRVGVGSAGGVPSAIAFGPIGTVADLDAAPGTYVDRFEVWYNPPFTTWTSGGTAAGTVELNIPDRYIIPVIHDGAAAVMQLADPNARSQSEGWRRYEAHVARVRGMVGNNRGAIIANEQEYI